MRKYLENLRKEKHETQQDVANALGITRQYYSQIEAGTRQKKMDTMIISALSAHFNVSAAQIFCWEQDLMLAVTEGGE